jgi:hypothetical protein
VDRRCHGEPVGGSTSTAPRAGTVPPSRSRVRAPWT